jgi:hypothetical protein
MTLQASTRSGIPPIRISRCDPARREPGMMLFNLRGDSSPAGKQSYSGWLIGIDQPGKLTTDLAATRRDKVRVSRSEIFYGAVGIAANYT